MNNTGESLLQWISNRLFNEGLNDKTIIVDQIGLRKNLKAFIWKIEWPLEIQSSVSVYAHTSDRKKETKPFLATWCKIKETWAWSSAASCFLKVLFWYEIRVLDQQIES